MTGAGRLGVMIDRDTAPEQLVPTAQGLEAMLVDEVWVVEDLGWGGGVASAATVLATTQRVRVGIGIMPAPLRNPALAAMELATLARLHPGRLIAGIGHGVQDWMRQVGAAVPSPLALLEDTFAIVRGLLFGERVVHHGRARSADGVALVHPAGVPVPLLAGVTGPRSLELAGRIADGVVLAEGAGPAQIAEARALAGDRAYSVTVLCHLFASEDAAEAAAVRLTVAREFFGDEAREFTMASGSAGEAAEVVRALWAAGADSVVLRPVGEPLAQTARVVAALAAGGFGAP